MSHKRPGRPKGSPNIDVLVQVEPSRCPSSGSSHRTKYQNPSYRDYSGAGPPFIGIYYRSCKCEDCGQARRDQEKVYAPKSATQGNSTMPSSPARLPIKSISALAATF